MTQARTGVLAAALLAAAIGIMAWPASAVAEFTCSTNADCFERAQQCDPGGIPCNDGICSPGSPGADAIGCVLVPNDGNCDDDNFCNGLEYCDTHHGCQVGSPPNCNDQIACTVDSCDTVANKCKHDRKNSLCSNGLFCDGVEKCDAEEGCVAGTPVNCNDNSTCTVDTCDEATDQCKHNGNNSQCDDGQFCNGVETCGPNGCLPGTPPNCNDGIACTADACNEQTDSCTHQPNNSLCSDGKFCDGTETCNPNSGCQEGPPPNCNDQVPCTIDRCVEGINTCTHSPDNSQCNDSKYCNGVETCNAVEGCLAGTPIDCGDNVDCTIDTCNETTDSCNHLENPSFCDDDLYCNGVERCDALLGCYFGFPPDCADNTDCTVDVCIEDTDTCGHTASNDLCDDSLFCNGDEVCSPLLGCTPGTAPNCSDDIDCTDDTCSNATQSCIHTPDSEKCTNGLFCDGNEVCNPAMGCTPGTPISCNDNLTCTNDACFEPEDECRNVPNGALCGNGIPNPECGEECDEDNGEICNNGIDDDGDQLVDCADPDCNQVLTETCDDQCRLVPPCVPLQRDPAIIKFNVGGERSVEALGDETTPMGHGKYSFHARIMPTTPIDPIAEGFTIVLSNANGEIYKAVLQPSDFRWQRSSYVYAAEDPGTVMREGGIARIGLRKRFYNGEPGFGIRLKAYGDFSRATLPEMTTQVYFGNDVGYVSATWNGEPGDWTLRPKDYE